MVKAARLYARGLPASIGASGDGSLRLQRSWNGRASIQTAARQSVRAAWATRATWRRAPSSGASGQKLPST
jgi:hypothetical protein